ncbi:MAG: ABC transporter substrate-binding protein [Butyricicoccaceae bacterium]
MKPTGSMELQYASQFCVDYYDGGYALITIGDSDRYLLVPESGEVPDGLDSSIAVLRQPAEKIYLAASSAMDLFSGLDALDHIRLTSTTLADWSLPEIRQALEQGDILYAGKYNTPDYELVLSENCDLAIESTMIYHNPETQEQLENLGIPVMVERSSYESHPLGRMEWIKLYGLLLGKTDEAESFFDQKVAQLDSILTGDSTGKTVAFFYISSNGYVNVRKPGDYISKMIELAGGRYIFSADDLNVEENALSTTNLQMEAFYASARDADYLIYNSTIDGELDTIDQLLEKSELLADFKAVKEHNVWCTEKNMFQQTTGAADMISDLHAIVTGEADAEDQLTFLHRLQ